MFNLSTICINTALQSLAPLSDRIVSHMLAELFLFLHIPLTQFTNTLGLLLIYKDLRIYNMSMDKSHSALKSFN